MFGWFFTRKRALYEMITETNSEYLKMSEEKGARIKELEGQVETAQQIRKAYCRALENFAHAARAPEFHNRVR